MILIVWLPRLTLFWIICSQISSNSLKFSISSQPGWQAGTIKATLVIIKHCIEVIWLLNIKSFLKLNIQFHASTNVAHCASWNAVWALKEYCNMPLNCISDIPLFVREIIKTICFADEVFTWISVHSFCDFFIWNYFQMKKNRTEKRALYNS